SSPSIDEIPTNPPPQPPTTRVTHSPVARAGNVSPQKKSVPSTRRASRTISKGGTGTAPAHFAPVRDSPQPSRSEPSSVSSTSPPMTLSQESISGTQGSSATSAGSAGRSRQDG